MNGIHVVLFYLNFRADGFSHDGLGVNGSHCVKVLRKLGIFAECRCVRNRDDIEKELDQRPTVTHVIIEAPWLPATEVMKLMRRYTRTMFCCRIHSQISFLQVDHGAMRNLEGYQLIQDGDVGFVLAANNMRFCSSYQRTHNSFIRHLPNLYDLERPFRRRAIPHQHRLLRVASFGALRPMKNHLTAARAAQEMAKQRGCDLEFWVSTGRDEQHGVLQGINNLFSAHPWAKAVGNVWQPWAAFRHTIARMDLSIQASYTESFNIVTADAVAEGVPAVASPAVEWLPSFCQADPDDASEIARVGSMLLNDPYVCAEAVQALDNYVAQGTRLWQRFIEETKIPA